MERKFALIGHPLGHTLSPMIHERLFELSGRGGSYETADIPENELKNNTPRLSGLCGYNVTIPYKVEIIPFLSHLDETAKRYGAVNCVSNKNGASVGYNTDCIGFLRSLEAESLSLSGRVLLLGCGGAGRMMAIESILHGANLTVAVRNPEKAAEIVSAAKAISPKSKISFTSFDEIDGEFDLCINSTPVGMFPNCDQSPIDEKTVSKCGAVFDAVYNPAPTRLTEMFLKQGKTAVGGGAMLVWQAVAAHEIWDGSRYRGEDIAALIEETEKHSVHPEK